MCPLALFLQAWSHYYDHCNIILMIFFTSAKYKACMPHLKYMHNACVLLMLYSLSYEINLPKILMGMSAHALK